VRLDNYDLEEVDDQEYGGMDIGQRRELERQMNKEARARNVGVPGAYMDDEDDDIPLKRRHRRAPVEEDLMEEEVPSLWTSS